MVYCFKLCFHFIVSPRCTEFLQVALVKPERLQTSSLMPRLKGWSPGMGRGRERAPLSPPTQNPPGTFASRIIWSFILSSNREIEGHESQALILQMRKQPERGLARLVEGASSWSTVSQDFFTQFLWFNLGLSLCVHVNMPVHVYNHVMGPLFQTTANCMSQSQSQAQELHRGAHGPSPHHCILSKALQGCWAALLSTG